MAITKQNKVSSATTLSAVNVSANAISEVTDPYNQDYVLPNATSGTKTDTPTLFQKPFKVASTGR